MFEKLRLWWKIKRADYVIMLDGRPGAGKNTLLSIIEGKDFIDIHNPTQTAVEYYTDLEVENKKWVVCNTRGWTDVALLKKKLRDKLPKKKTLWIEVFDMSKYDEVDEAFDCILLSDEIVGGYKAAERGGFKFLAFGTYLDTNKDKQERIQNDLAKKGIRVALYELSKNPQKEIIELIKALYS